MTSHRANLLSATDEVKRVDIAVREYARVCMCKSNFIMALFYGYGLESDESVGSVNNCFNRPVPYGHHAVHAPDRHRPALRVNSSAGVRRIRRMASAVAPTLPGEQPAIDAILDQFWHAGDIGASTGRQVASASIIATGRFSRNSA